jgi:hypothetical protein
MDQSGIRGLRVALVLYVLLAPAPVGSKEQSFNAAVVGTWKLSSLYDEDASAREVAIFGLHPAGHLMLDSAANFSFQLISDLHWTTFHCRHAETVVTRQSEGPGTVAYFGKYFIDPRHRIHLLVEHGLTPEWDHADRVADLTIAGDRMEFVSSMVASPSGSNYSHLVWQRLP